jgi:O-acetyl-ADP-ribose deacetylase
MNVRVVHGDLLDQDVDVVVNAWNRNFLPWWLLVPQGVSRAIRRRAGTAPFRELRRHGVLPPGAAVRTTAGALPHRAIVHVAGIGWTWRASERSVRASVRNAIANARDHGDRSIAFPLIGTGTGGRRQQQVLDWMQDELRGVEFAGEVRIVVFAR